MDQSSDKLFNIFSAFLPFKYGKEKPIKPPYILAVNDIDTTIELMDLVKDYPSELGMIERGSDDLALDYENQFILLSCSFPVVSGVPLDTIYSELLFDNYGMKKTKGATVSLHLKDQDKIFIHYVLPFRLKEIHQELAYQLTLDFFSVSRDIKIKLDTLALKNNRDTQVDLPFKEAKDTYTLFI